MPTLNDLRAALDHLADRAAPGCEDAIAERVQQRRARRRGIAGVLAVAVAAGVALTAVPLVTTRPPATPAASQSGPPVIDSLPMTRFVFDLAPPTGYTVYDLYTSPTAQAMTLYTVDEQHHATVVLYAPGNSRPDRPADARDVVVNGATGFYGTLRLAQGYGSAVTLPDALTWPYQPGAWAVVYGFIKEQQPSGIALTEAQTRQVASWVHIGRYHPARVPMRFRQLTGLEILGVIHRRTSSSDRPERRNALIALGPAGTSTITLMLTAAPISAGGCPRGAGQAVTIGGYTGTYLARDNQLTLCDRHTYLSVDGSSEVGRTQTIPFDQLRDMVQGMTLAPDLTDPTTWFDATSAIG